MESKFSEIIKSSLDGIKQVAGADTVIGNPITTANGSIIIPVSKLSVGFASVGIDYLGKNAAEKTTAAKDQQTNFGGGGGTGLTVTPVAFLIIKADGDVELLSISNPVPADPVSTIADFLERSPELIARIKEIFNKKPSDGAE
jgi:sporulation protein YtfJ